MRKIVCFEKESICFNEKRNTWKARLISETLNVWNGVVWRRMQKIIFPVQFVFIFTFKSRVLEWFNQNNSISVFIFQTLHPQKTNFESVLLVKINYFFLCQNNPFWQGSCSRLFIHIKKRKNISWKKSFIILFTH